jgi:hypothetical protein
VIFHKESAKKKKKKKKMIKKTNQINLFSIYKSHIILKVGPILKVPFSELVSSALKKKAAPFLPSCQME